MNETVDDEGLLSGGSDVDDNMDVNCSGSSSDDESEDNGISVGSDDDSDDSDYVSEGLEGLDTDETSLDADDIFGDNTATVDQLILNVDTSNYLQMPADGPSNYLNENDMRDFDEDAPDLDDELLSLHGSDSDRDAQNVQYNGMVGNLALGMHFRDSKEFRKALKSMSIEEGYPYKYRKNSKTVVWAVCKDGRCDFKIRASKVRNSSSLRIKSYKPVHTCPRNFDPRLVTADYLSTKYLEDLRGDNDMKVTTMKNKLKLEFGYDISLRKCYRAKNKGISIISGEVREQYRRLYDYAQTVMVTNPGSMVTFKTELSLDQNGAVPREVVVLQHMYYRLAAQKQGFSGLSSPSGPKLYEVVCGDKAVAVDLNARTCTCRLWDISGVPCKHAIAAIFSNRETPEQYMHYYFMKECYLEVYQHTIKPVPSKEEWERTGLPDMVPGVVRKPPGRPKKRRIRGIGESSNPHTVTRKGGVKHCGKCQQPGHNAKGCKAGVTGETPWERRKRRATTIRMNGQVSPPKRGGRPRKSTTTTTTTQTQEYVQSGHLFQSASQPIPRENAMNVNPSYSATTERYSQTTTGRGRGRPPRGRGMQAQANFRPPKAANVNPSYSATTISASRKQVNHPTEGETSSSTRPRRHTVLEDLARRHGIFSGNLDN